MSLIYINNKESHSLACRNKLEGAAPQFRLKINQQENIKKEKDLFSNLIHFLKKE